MKSIITGVFLLLSLLACTKQSPSLELQKPSGPNANLYSAVGAEHKVHFQAEFHSSAVRVEDVDSESLMYEIKRTTPFLFGPLTYRELAGIQKGEKIQVLMDQAVIKDGHVSVPYNYDGTWLIYKSDLAQGTLQVPVPYSDESLRTANWQQCTDIADEDHSDWGFFWYFWDPTRPGCEHQEGVQYQQVTLTIDPETVQTTATAPQYARMIRNENGVQTLAMTYAFGYVAENPNPQPFTDSDPGMQEFQKFYRQTKTQLSALGFQERSILQSEISSGTRAIGAEFTGMKNGVQLRVSILAAAGVDQMDIFAHSFARKHEGFFGWFGHSRVGSGFDADHFRMKLMMSPDQYSMTSDYQMIYWAGCDSYSYYTQPFFALKAQLDPTLDPNGTRNLDIISNALPSLFAFNAGNAAIVSQALMNWEQPTTYQSIVDRIEAQARSWGSRVIVNVLGDEDNQ